MARFEVKAVKEYFEKMEEHKFIPDGISLRKASLGRKEESLSLSRSFSLSRIVSIIII